MRITPIATTQPCWSVLIPTLKDLLDLDVHKRFENLSQTTKDTSAFCIAIGGDLFEPMTDVFSLHYLTFILELDDSEQSVLREFKYSSVLELSDQIYVISENVLRLESIIISLGSHRKPAHRDLGYRLLKMIELGGFPNIAQGYERKKLKDGTFQLCRR
jgi:hypothetical protein